MTEYRCKHRWINPEAQCPECREIRLLQEEIKIWKDKFYYENKIAKAFEKELREAVETSRILDEQLKDAHVLIQKLHKRYGDRIYEPN